MNAPETQSTLPSARAERYARVAGLVGHTGASSACAPASQTLGKTRCDG